MDFPDTDDDEPAPTQAEVPAETEHSLYLDDRDSVANPFDYWDSHGDKFARLFKHSRMVVSTPASTAGEAAC